jgi:hypothetical protein
MKPKLLKVQVQVTSNEGTTYATWFANKKVMKKMVDEPDLMKWFTTIIRQCREHYPEAMGG